MAKSPISQDWQGVSGIFTRHSDVVVCRLPGHPRVLITRGHRIFDGRGIGHGKISHRIASMSFQMQFCILDSWQVKKSLRIKIRAIFWHIAFSARDAASDIAQNGPQTAQGASKRPWPVSRRTRPFRRSGRILTRFRRLSLRHRQVPDTAEPRTLSPAIFLAA